MFLIYIFTGASQSAHEAPLVPGVHMHRLLHRSRPGNLRLEIFSLTLLNLGRYRAIEVSVFFRYLEPRPGNLSLLFAEATFEGKARRWTRSGDPDSVVACVYIYVYVCMSIQPSPYPTSHREGNIFGRGSGKIWERAGPSTSPGVLGRRCYFREFGGGGSGDHAAD